MKFVRLIFLLSVVFASIWFCGLIWFGLQIADNKPDGDENTDAIVVLTGGSERLKEGLMLLEKNYASRLFISGAGAGVTIKDLFLNANYPLDNFTDLSRRIEIGYKAQTTHGNAQEVSNWMKNKNFRTLRLITSNYHMQRSHLEISYLLPDTQIIKHPVVPKNVILENWWQYHGTRDLIISEYNKLLGAMINREFSRNRRRSKN